MNMHSYLQQNVRINHIALQIVELYNSPAELRNTVRWLDGWVEALCWHLRTLAMLESLSVPLRSRGWGVLGTYGMI